jgi:hypothetical protein
VQVERNRILDAMEEEINQALLKEKVDDFYTDSAVYFLSRKAAEAALRVIEQPLGSSGETYSRICTCGQSGYPENSPHSNHPHRKGCPQYTGLYDDNV